MLQPRLIYMIKKLSTNWTVEGHGIEWANGNWKVSILLKIRENYTTNRYYQDSLWEVNKKIFTGNFSQLLVLKL